METVNNLLSILSKGGWLMLPILLTSIIAVAIIVDKYIVVRKAKVNIPALIVKIRGFLKHGDISGAHSYCLEKKSPITNIIKKSLKKYHLGRERVKEALENAGRQEITRLEKGLSLLATISGVAPLLGFLGTVTGMIGAFMRIEDLKGGANPSDLAGGIWEALITTAFGLAVGIIAYTFYNFLTAKITKLVMDMEAISNDLVDTIEEIKTDTKKLTPDDIEDEIELEL
ncbi:MAG: MotA/TolQ/ExbB proton channel family protein [Ignavibacteriales bacterium]|nr:MotA/TolQ/ExbB proton channel family protein [Ignavibacteriales bacterium]